MLLSASASTWPASGRCVIALDLGELVARLSADSTQLDRELDKTPGKLKETGAKAAKAAAAAGIAIGGALGAAVLQAMDVEAANDKLAAQLGLSAEESNRLGKVAGEVYAGAYGDSLGQVNDTIVAITQRIGEGNSAWLKTTTQGVLDLSATFGQESDAIATAVGNMLNTGLFKDSATALDAVAAAFQGGADKGGALLDTLTQAGPNLVAFGLSGQDALGLIQQGLDAGAESADTVTGLFEELVGNAADVEGFAETVGVLGLNGKQMAADLASGGDRANGALDLLLDTIRNTEDPLKRSAAIAQLFGEEGSALQGVLMSLDPSQAAARLGDFDGTLSELGATLADNAGTNLESFKRQVTTTFVDFVGGKALPAVNDIASALATGLGPAVETVTPLVQAAGAAAIDLGEAIPTPILQGAAIAVGALALVLGTEAAVTAAASAATGAYTAVKGIFVSTTNAETGAVTLSTVARIGNTVSTGAATVATTAWTAAQWLLNAAMSANPLALVTIAIAALVAGVVIAYRESETFRNIVTGAFNAVQTAASFMWDNVLKPIFRLWLDTWFTLIDAIVSGAAAAFGWVPGLGDKLKAANREFDSFRDGVNASLDGVNDNAVEFSVVAKYQGVSNLGAGAAGATTLSTNRADGGPVLPARAGGGPIGGVGGGRQDNIAGIDRATGTQSHWLSAGEFVVNEASYKKHRALVEAINADKGPALPGRASGGLVLNARGDASSVGPGLATTMEAARAAAVATARPIAQAAADKYALAQLGGSAGTAQGRDDILRFIRSTDPLPYVWGGVGPNGYDCSGLVGEVLNRMIGRRSFQRAFTTASIGVGQFGLKPGAGGTLSIGVTPGSGHMAGEYGGLPFEAESTKTGIKIGAAASPVGSFARKFHLADGGLVERLAEVFSVAGDPGNLTLDDRPAREVLPAAVYDQGGWLEPNTVAVNRGRRPEAVLDPEESAGLKAMLRQRGEPVLGGVTYAGDVYVVDPDEFARKTVARQRDVALVHGLRDLVNA